MVPDKPYNLPDPRRLPASFLTLLYKTMRGVAYDNREWDKEFWGRCNKRTTYLLECLGGDVQLAARCMQEVRDQLEADGTKWTIETICQYSFEWNTRRQHIDDRTLLNNFIGAYKAQIGELKRADITGLLEKIKALPEAPPNGKEAIPQTSKGELE